MTPVLSKKKEEESLSVIISTPQFSGDVLSDFKSFGIDLDIYIMFSRKREHYI